MSVIIAATQKFGVLDVSEPKLTAHKILMVAIELGSTLKPLPAILCKICSLSYGTPEQSGKCSSCFGRIPRITFRVHNLDTIQTTKIVATSNIALECLCCFEEKLLVRKFSCCCRHLVCADCAPKVSKCPTCRAAAYVQIDAHDLDTFITAIYTNKVHKWFVTTVRKHAQLCDGIVKLKTFYAHPQSIVSAIRTRTSNGSYRGYSERRTLSGFIIAYAAHHNRGGGVGMQCLFKQASIEDGTDDCADYGISQRINLGYVGNYGSRFCETHTLIPYKHPIACDMHIEV